MNFRELICYCVDAMPEGQVVIEAMKLTGEWYRPLAAYVSSDPYIHDLVPIVPQDVHGIRPIYDSQLEAICAAHTMVIRWLKEQEEGYDYPNDYRPHQSHR